MKTCVRKFELSNSLIVLVYDTTRRYYEDYHLVRLEIESDIVVQDDFFATSERLAEARRLLGNSVTYRRTVEKMGVPFVEIEQAREEMIASFVTTALPYFATRNFPQKFVMSELTKASEKMLRSAV